MQTKLILTFFFIVLSLFAKTQVYLGIVFGDAFVNIYNKESIFLKKIAIIGVKEVAKNSPAEKAGIKVGDLIASVNNKDILSGEDFKKILSQFQPNELITLLIQRDDTSFNKTVVLEMAPAEFKEKMEEQNNKNNDYKIGLKNNNSEENKLSSDPAQALNQLKKLKSEINTSNKSLEEKRVMLDQVNAAIKQLENNIDLQNLNYKNNSNIKVQEKKYFTCDFEFKQEAVKIVGNLLYLNLKFTNRSNKTIDNIEFSVDYFNIYNDFIVKKDYTWEPDLFMDPIKPNTFLTYVRPEYLNENKSIKRYSVYIKRIHYTNDTVCIF